MVPQEPGPWRAGTTFREVRRIDELEPNRLMELRSLTGRPFQGHWRFASAGTGTRLQWTGRWSCPGRCGSSRR